jgi:hypothetical protein
MKEIHLQWSYFSESQELVAVEIRDWPGWFRDRFGITSWSRMEPLCKVTFRDL